VAANGVFIREAFECFRKNDVTRFPTRSRQKSCQIGVVRNLVDLAARFVEGAWNLGGLAADAVFFERRLSAFEKVM
jgi:hypothetical protein